MRKKLLNRISVIAVFACLCLPVLGQRGFLFQVALDSVPQQGFYQINLQPLLAAELQPNLADIRITDADGKQVPYILKSDIPAFSESRFKELPIVSSKKEADRQTHVVIANTTGLPLSELLLFIKNTDANRTVTLSGSDDSSHWYIIKENIPLNNFFTTEGDHFIQSLVFPTSNYHYFKIIINGKDVLPVNIIKAGIYEQSFINGKYMPLPAPRLVHRDSTDKYTYIFLRFNDHYFIDRLELQIEGPKFYQRSLLLYPGFIGSAPIDREYTLRSDSPAILLPGVKTNHLLLKIRNDDNPPLQKISVSAFQLNRYLYTYLEKGKAYYLRFGDSAVAAPVYDLQYFKDSISAAPTILGYGRIELNKLSQGRTADTQGNRAIFLWIILASVLIVLVLLTAKMARDINKRNS